MACSESGRTGQWAGAQVIIGHLSGEATLGGPDGGLRLFVPFYVRDLFSPSVKLRSSWCASWWRRPAPMGRCDRSWSASLFEIDQFQCELAVILVCLPDRDRSVPVRRCGHRAGPLVRGRSVPVSGSCHRVVPPLLKSHSVRDDTVGELRVCDIRENPDIGSVGRLLSRQGWVSDGG